MIPKRLMIFAAMLTLMACDYSLQTNRDAGADAGPLEPGAACQCFGASQACCDTGLTCFFSTPCNVKTDSGCFTEGMCVAKRKEGETCNGAEDCAESGSACSGTSSSPIVCRRADAGSQACLAAGRSCAGAASNCCSGSCALLGSGLCN